MQHPMERHYSVVNQQGEEFCITPELWLRNQQQQTALLRYLALPLKEDAQTLWLGLDSLTNLAACETFSFLSGKHIEPVLLPSHVLKRTLQDLTKSEKVEENQPLFYSTELQEQPDTQQIDEPIIQQLNQIFENATQKKASDIHLEPQAEGLQVRFRIDGVLQVQEQISRSLANRLISRLKLLAKLDISETRLPQDGRFQFKTTFSDILDFRLSTLATQFGEKAVLRLQQNRPVQLEFSELGMTESQQQLFRHALSQPQGLILVTGPTGSGKTLLAETMARMLNVPFAMKGCWREQYFGNANPIVLELGCGKGEYSKRNAARHLSLGECFAWTRCSVESVGGYFWYRRCVPRSRVGHSLH